jgi:hypothetical protein
VVGPLLRAVFEDERHSMFRADILDVWNSMDWPEAPAIAEAHLKANLAAWKAESPLPADWWEASVPRRYRFHEDCRAIWLLGLRGAESAEEVVRAVRVFWRDSGVRPSVPYGHGYETDILAECDMALAQLARLRARGAGRVVELTGKDANEQLAALEDPASIVEIDASRAYRLSDADLVDLVGCTSLRSLSLAGNRGLTGEGLVHLPQPSALRDLSLGATSITDENLSLVGNLTALEILSLGGTDITSAGLPHLSGLAKLRSLDLSDTLIDDAGLAHLRGLKALESLDLAQTNLTDAGLEPLHALASLRQLDLPSTRPVREGDGTRYLEVTGITTKGVASLRAALPRCRITGNEGAASR